YYASRAWLAYKGMGFPYGTFFVNLTGALLIGCFATAFDQADLASPPLRHLVLTGLLGSYTTFSTYIVDIYYLAKGQSWWSALVYGLGSLGGGLVCVGIGRYLALWLLA
ncbi:MAG: CrcB family protein, partial [Leptolyngbyaceae cyanobacterium SM2_5_2]|nr:CrcB family protein [Leptolyngbyaceae cyanobacterium SM2_5_2]